MKKQFNLSEKLLYYGAPSSGRVIMEEDVKEFIELLKEECDKNDGYVDIDFINRRAGDKLI